MLIQSRGRADFGSDLGAELGLDLVKIISLLDGQPNPRTGARRGADPQRRSGVTARLPATISWMRCGGTRRRSANAAALTPRASSCSFRIVPGCTA